MSGPLKVLLIEDSPTDAALIIHELGRSGQQVEWERVENAEAMRAALDRKRWDALVVDWTMPAFGAVEALGIFKELQLDIPFIIVSGTVGEEQAVEAMRAGAHDYVLKDRLARLAPAVEREVRERAVRAGRRQAEDSLRVSEARFARLWDSGIVAIIVADVFGRILEANDAYAAMLGYSREELLSGAVGWDSLTPPEWKASDDLAVSLLKEHGVAHAWEKEMLRKDGRRVPVLISVAMLDYPHCIVFLSDLTERKRAQAALRETEDRLAQSQKMEAIGSLAAGIAHDFNNLLTVILSYSSMLVGDLKVGDPMRADLEEIQMAGRRAGNLTRQLLAFSRQQVLQPQLVDLNAVVAEIETMLGRLIGEHIELVTSGPHNLGRVMVDPGQIEQVIMNLVINSRDAMPDGGKLSIETAEVVLDESFAAEHPGITAGRHIMLGVTDTGTGMDKATMARMFEPFFTTKEKGKGTGLGLSTVFGIVEQSGAVASVWSEPGRGTSFKIYFPRAADASSLADVSTEASSPPELEGWETILLVEDEEQVRKLAGTILRRHGYHVVESHSAGDALLICELHRGTIHLCLTDVVMPRMSGQQLAERLQSMRPDMKILYMSGYTDPSIVHHGLLDPGIAFLQKPITPEMLTRKVRRMLSG